MKIHDTLLATVKYLETYEFPEEVWLDFKDTVRDEDGFPEHEEDIRFMYSEEFYEWLNENFENDSRIIKTSSDKIINGEAGDIEWEL